MRKEGIKIKFDVDELARLREYAKAEDASVGQIVRRAVKEFFAANETKASKS